MKNHENFIELMEQFPASADIWICTTDYKDEEIFDIYKGSVEGFWTKYDNEEIDSFIMDAKDIPVLGYGLNKDNVMVVLI